jgi:exopolyphosphatase/guanosine-5'-triphosphate,3'-diphosphate pyrophosphatase
MLNQLGDTCALYQYKEAKKILAWAGELHEIGHDIAHHQYHKHSAYVIENGDLAGFTRQDQTVLATIIRYHRRKFNLAGFKELPAPWNQLGPLAAILLRLAVVLRRNRQGNPLPDFKIEFPQKNKIKLRFPIGWLLESPLTHADLFQEADYLKQAGYKLDFA